MSHIEVKRFGLAVGTTMALLYLGCMLVMAATSTPEAIQFFNSLIHGIDVTNVMRTEMPLWEALIGLVEIFVLGWLSGAVVAVIYNVSLKK